MENEGVAALKITKVETQPFSDCSVYFLFFQCACSFSFPLQLIKRVSQIGTIHFYLLLCLLN